MVKLTILYKKPADTTEFDRYYQETHMPLANKMPGLKKVEIAKVLGSPAGDCEYHLVTSLYFENRDALNAAMSSQEGKAAARDVKNFASGPVEMIICEVN